MTLTAIVAAWLIGLWLGARVGLSPAYLLPGALFLLVLAILLRRTRAALFLACAAICSLGVVRYQIGLPCIDDSHLARYNDSGQASVRGVVVGEPEPDGSRFRAVVRAEDLQHAHGYAPVHGSVLVVLPAFPQVHDGDRVAVRGELLTPPAFPDFSYKDYLARQGIHSLVYAQSVNLEEPARGGIGWALTALRARSEAVIGRLLPEPEASLLAGILLGRDAGIPDGVMDDFRVTGTAHIIAISGFNVTLLCGLFLGLFTRAFGKRRALLLAIPCIALYTAFVGADPPVLRAAIMGTLSLAALRLGRRSDALNALAISALVMTAVEPQMLFDVGFQLSVAATLGLILYATPLQEALEKSVVARLPGAVPREIVRWLDEGLVVTFAAQILTLPITVAYFNNLSPLSLLANLLILPAQPYVMTWGGSALLLGLAWLPLGLPVASVAWLFLAYTIGVAGVVAGLPGASLNVPRVSPFLIAGYYALLAVATLGWPRLRNWLPPAARLARRLLPRWRLPVATALAATLVWAGALQMPDGRLHVHFLDVGEGDAALIETPRGQTVLIDGGSDPAALLAEVGRRLPFWKRDIDIVALSHPHADHAGGLVGVLERYRVGMFVDARAAGIPEYKACMAAVQARGIPHVQTVPGQRFVLDEGVVLEVLYPPPETTCQNANDCSIVFRLTIGQAEFLFLGDVEKMAQISLINQTPLPKCVALKVPHHGSQNALCEALLAEAAPDVAVIQSGPRTAADPSPATLSALDALGSTVWQTGRQGPLEIVTDGERYWMKPPP